MNVLSMFGKSKLDKSKVAAPENHGGARRGDAADAAADDAWTDEGAAAGPAATASGSRRDDPAGYDDASYDDPALDDTRRDDFADWEDAAPYDDRQGGPGDLSPLDSTGALAAFGLAKSYGGRKVVRDVSINVRRGEAVGLLGPNGAGKTTCFYMVTGLVKADAGRIELDGHDITPMPMYRRARLGVGYLPQEASIFRGLSVEDNIMGVLEVTEPNRARRREETEALLEEFRITHVRKSPSIALSGGERRRLEIARALASQPSFMLLDEPFAGIDPIAVGDIQALVRHLTTRGIGVLITDHNVRETLGLIDRAYIIHSGSVLMEGDPEAIVSSPDVRRLYLGEEFRL
ncbi:LPS export ABC transporter ATP-binding protein [Xanthobacter sp. AM11]|uniref:LPS export ABC transporter ATP-binding protein n=1 Tax=Xanthobacter sp. AM11 TaxID=3380643 RepID=UPI0039BF2DED